MTYSVVGKRLPRIDSPAKAIGQAKYAADLSLPRMLSGKILRSPHAHARIISIDTSRAERLSGVKAVLTGQDIPRVKYGLLLRNPQFCDEYMLAVDKVRFIGEGVAAVAAVDEDTALEALDLIRVEYEVLPSVADPEEAMEPGAPLVHDLTERNIGVHLSYNFGDVERGLMEADHVRQDRFRLQAQAHASIEPHAVLADPDPSGKLTMWASKQGPFRIRYALSRTLGISDSMIRVIQPTLGGGFGGKVEMMCLDFCAAALARRSGRPVRIVYTQEESLCTTRARHPMIVEVKTGVKKDGTLVAQSFLIVADGGAYMGPGPISLYLAASLLHLPYRVPNVRVEGYRVYTNQQPSGAMRGHGTPQVRFAIESQLDMIAEELGLDPLELRLRNAVERGYIALNGYVVSSCGYKDALERAARAIRWKEGLAGRRNSNRGVGLAGYSFLSGVRGHTIESDAALSSAIIRLQESGAVHLVTGAADIGQGADTILCQMAAEELGVGLEDVTILARDTDLCPVDYGTSASRVTYQAGNAVRAAARDARRQILEGAADHLEARPEDLELRDRRVFVKGSPDRGVALPQAIAMSMRRANGASVIGQGSFDQTVTPLYDFNTGIGNISAAYAFGTHAAEVEVDRETGQVDVQRMAVFHDCGFAINPLLIEGQVEGASLMGSGYALTEELHRQDGATLNPSFLEYKVPTALDGFAMEGATVESIDPGGPYGAKEAGEGLMIAAAPAVTNAIYNAIGIRMTETPVTPEKVLRALEESARATG